MQFKTNNEKMHVCANIVVSAVSMALTVMTIMMMMMSTVFLCNTKFNLKIKQSYPIKTQIQAMPAVQSIRNQVRRGYRCWLPTEMVHI